ncbi:hypothetical protein LWI29_016895 [Acer saccharum]|uniref:Uncharacterized protein n=1 Tax=Acer saccharum TaxID=4024 RepID=A0AA39T3L1_ACESA|nr:hypothetical protein LWI29_016895 [Acer saccharum]
MVGNGGCGKKIWVRLHHGGRTTGENCSRNEVGNAPFPAAALKSREGWLELLMMKKLVRIQTGNYEFLHVHPDQLDEAATAAVAADVAVVAVASPHPSWLIGWLLPEEVLQCIKNI